MRFGQEILLDDGSTCGAMGCETRDEAIQRAVSLARHDGWRPRRWYEFWKPRCSADVRGEYLYQELNAKYTED